MSEIRREMEFRRIQRQLGQSSAERYAEYQQDIAALLDLIGDDLKTHANRAAKDPKNWCLTGDLNRIRETLKSVLVSHFATGEYSEVEADLFIEGCLEGMREVKKELP